MEKFKRYIRPALAALLLLLLFAGDVRAQTWGEFFNQGKTQKKYLLKQIAALQFYVVYARKGYELAGKGLETIKDIGQGEFGLHKAFMSSLKQVSPAVRGDARLAEIINMQLSVLQLSGSWGNQELLSPENRDYISGVRQNLRSKCLDALEELILILTAGRIEMEQEERIRRIGQLYGTMNRHLGFAREFTAEVNLLTASRERELFELEQMKERYEKFY